jgi:polyisoprenoid-binding protein YceI
MSTHAVDTLPATGTWEIDSRHSTMRFSVIHHAVAYFRAAFHPITGGYDAATRTLTGEVQSADLHVPIEQLRNHLLSPDFFGAEQFATIAFTSTRIDVDGSALTVEGDLTLKGVTRSVTATGSATAPTAVAHPDGSVVQHFGIELEATIDRRDYGVLFNNVLPSGLENLGWDVRIDAALELIEAG